MRKITNRRIVATATSCLGVVVLTSLVRQSGDAASSPSRRVEIVDRCGNIVRNSNGKPVVVEIQLEPPAANHLVVSDAAERAPLAESELVAAPIPADVRQVSPC